MNRTGNDAGPLILIAILVGAGIAGLGILGCVAFFLFARGGTAPTPVTAKGPPVQQTPAAVSAAGQYYEVAIAYPGASADELDRGWRGWLPDARQAEVVRTVCEQGRLRLYLASSLPARALEDSIATSQSFPSDVTGVEGWVTVTALPNGLPPKPAVAMVPQLAVNIDKNRTAALGISETDITRAMQGRNVADIEAIRNTTLKTPTGATVRLGEIAEIRSVTGPSHIVRDMP